FYEFARLIDAPFYPDFLNFSIALALVDFIRKVLRNVDMKYLWQYRALRFSGNGFYAWYDRHIDPLLPAFIHEIKIFLVVKKHLGDDILGAKIHFQLKVL